jgi:hypothetical protein
MNAKMVQKKCKKDEIFNPKTGRCVKKDGKIGKLLLLQYAQKKKEKNMSSSSFIKVYNSASHSCDFHKTLQHMFPHMSAKVVQTFHVLFKKYIIVLVKKLSVIHHMKKATRVTRKDILLVNTLCFDIKTPSIRQTHSGLYPCILSCLCREMKKILPTIVHIEKTGVEIIDTIFASSFQKIRNTQIENFIDTFYYDTTNIPQNIIFKKLFVNSLACQMLK